MTHRHQPGSTQSLTGPPEGLSRRARWAGGLYVWIELPDRIDTGLEGPLFDRAVAEGALYVPGAYCFPAFGRPARRNLLRLSFGSQSTPNGALTPRFTVAPHPPGACKDGST